MRIAATNSQPSLLDEVTRFANECLTEDSRERDASGEFWWQGWAKCAEFGVHGLPFPAEYGGLDQDLTTTVAAMEALGRACRDAGLLFAINAHMWAIQHPIWQFGTDEQKRRYLPRLISGEWVGAHGASEPESGSDVNSMRTTAERRDDVYALNGTKTWVTNAPIADLFVVFATLDTSKGLRGITAFLVEKDTPGLSLSSEIEKMGLRTSPMAQVFLDDCEVPAANRLGREGAGSTIFNSAMVGERTCILASQVGAMARQLDDCVRYAKTRRQFGKPIGKFQQISSTLADMRIRLETCRALLRSVAGSDARGPELMLQAAVAKAHVAECAVQSGLDAIQVHGTHGYAVENGVERDLRDAIGGRLYSGTTEIQKNIIARCMGL